MFSYIIFCENHTAYRRVRGACGRQKIDFISRKHIKEEASEYYLLTNKVPATEVRDGFQVFVLKETV